MVMHEFFARWVWWIVDTTVVGIMYETRFSERRTSALITLAVVNFLNIGKQNTDGNKRMYQEDV